MSDWEKPIEPDAERPVDPDEEATTSLPTTLPEAGVTASEADALEQHLEVPVDDDDRA